MRGSRRFCRGGGGGGGGRAESNWDVFFFFCLVDEGREDPNTTISGPSSARQRNAI